MRHTLTMGLLLGLVLGAAPSHQAVASNEAVNDLVAAYRAKVKAKRDENLAEEIKGMMEIDQLVRSAYAEILETHTFSDEELSLLGTDVFPEITTTDRYNTARLKEILQDYSWEELAGIRDDVAANAYLIVQHSGDTAFMESALPAFERFAHQGLVNGEVFAKMYDRVQVFNGRPQRYGTQLSCIDHKWVFPELENPERLEKWRSEMGLDPFEEAQKRAAIIQKNNC